MDQTEPYNNSKYHILAIDDDPVARKILQENLQPEYNVTAAASGREALEILSKEFPPDLILLDIMMPEIDGLQMCRKIKQDSRIKNIPIIFITAVTESEKEEEGLRLGAVDYINKPFKIELVRARVKNHLELKHLQDEHERLISEKNNALIHSRRQIEQKSIELQYLFETMGELLSSRDHYTSEHALRVASISTRIGKRMGLDREEIDTLEQGCLVHDIGKVAIPDDVLLKPGRFDREDRKIMECHPLIGGRIFAKHFTKDRISAIILEHHERLDGSGYPKGLDQKSIDPLSKIVMVADVYEALIARRPYKQPMSREQALKILYEEADKGLIEKNIVHRIKDITKCWDPLTITIGKQAEYQTTLEIFRKKTYFREPLSNFYNYRYLLYLEECQMLCCNTDHYHIIKTDFSSLKHYNHEHGYAEADHILDSIGLEYHSLLEQLNTKNNLTENTLMLFRRGADYLIYSEADDYVLEHLEKECHTTLRKAEEKWGLHSSVTSSNFSKTQPMIKALELLYS